MINLAIVYQKIIFYQIFFDDHLTNLIKIDTSIRTKKKQLGINL